MYPQYYSRQKWSTDGAAYMAGYVWIVALEAQPNTPKYRKLLSVVTKHKGNLF